MTFRLSALATLAAAYVVASGALYAVTARQAAELILLLAAVVTAVGVLWRAFRGMRANLTKRLGDWFDAANVRANAPLILQMAKVEERTRELVPNGGTSIADKVARIELLFYSDREMSAVEREAMRQLLDDLTARIDEIEARPGYKRFG